MMMMMIRHNDVAALVSMAARASMTSTAITAHARPASPAQTASIASTRATQTHAWTTDAARRVPVRRPRSTVPVSRGSPGRDARALSTGARPIATRASTVALACNAAIIMSASVTEVGVVCTATYPTCPVLQFPPAKVRVFSTIVRTFVSFYKKISK